MKCILYTQQNIKLKLKKAASLKHNIYFFHNKPFIPDCHLSVTPIPLQIFENRLWPQLPGFFSQLWSVPHPSFPEKSIPLRLRLVSQSKQGFDKWKSRCAVTRSHRSKPAAGFCARAWVLGVFWQLRSPFSYSVKFLHDPFTLWRKKNGSKTHLQELCSLCPGLSHVAGSEVETGDVHLQRLQPEIDKN